MSNILGNIEVKKFLNCTAAIIAAVTAIFLVSCKKEEVITETDIAYANIDLRLEMPTRSGGNKHDEINEWFINGSLTNKRKERISIALMIYNHDKHAYTYSYITPCRAERNGLYKTKIDIPTGRCDFYVFYAANQFPGDSKTAYYDNKGVLHDNMPWNFHSPFSTKINKADLDNSGFPVFFEKYGNTYKIPNVPYNKQVGPDAVSNNIFMFERMDKSPWVSKELSYGNKSPMYILSGKKTVDVKKKMTVEIPLYRDYARFKFYIATEDKKPKKFCIESIGFLNIPFLTTPSFRENDSYETVKNCGVKGSLQDKVGTYSYGFLYSQFKTLTPPKVPDRTDRTIEPMPLKGNKIDESRMVNDEKYELIIPQYVAPFIPAANKWQAGQEHPKLYLNIGIYNDEGKLQRTKEYIVDIGEKGSGKNYDGAIYPNREYRVFVIIPESINQELTISVSKWTEKGINIPEFQ